MSFSRVTKQSIEEMYLTVLLDLLSKLDVSILFVQVFVEFVDIVFVYSSDRIVNVALLGPVPRCFA